MSDEQDKLKLSLEPPKLFGRKKRSARTETDEAAAPTPVDDAPEAATELDTGAGELEPGDAAAEEPTVVLEPSATAESPETDDLTETADDTADETADAEPTVALTPAATAPMPAETDPVAVPADDPELDEAETAAPRRAPLRGVAAVAAARAGRAARSAREAMARPEEVTADDEAPLLTVYRAAALTGLVVGAALVTLTWLALRGCEAVRDTTSCGGGPGLVLLVGTFAVCVYLGAALLRAFLLPGPGSTSFIAVGSVAVICLAFLTDVLDHWSVVIVVPLLTIATFMGSVWLASKVDVVADT